MNGKNCNGCSVTCGIPVDHVDDDFREKANDFNDHLINLSDKCPCGKCLIKSKCCYKLCQDFITFIQKIWKDINDSK